MTAFELLAIRLSDALQTQVDAYKEEIAEQGHVDTGRLINSIDKKVYSKLTGLLRGEITAVGYGIPVSTGVPANKVKYNPFWLLESGWAKRKKPTLSDKELKSFVFAVWNKHKKYGIPSSGSKAYTKNGHRTKWIERGFKSNEAKFSKEISKALGKYAVDLANEILKEIQNESRI